MPTADLGAVTIYFERGGVGPGQGEPLLFISGTGSDLRHKPNMFDSPVAREFDLLAYDQRGLGQSSVPDPPSSMADYADDAAALLDEVGWDSCLIMGVSFGGMVAQELVLRHPARVRRLVLACTSAGGPGGASYPLHELTELHGRERAERLRMLADTRWDAGRRAERAQEWERTLNVMTARMDPLSEERQRGASMQLSARQHHDTATRLGQIGCPTLVCGGRHDGIAPLANSEHLAAHIPGATLAVFEGGHQFFVQDRAAFPRMIQFLQGREEPNAVTSLTPPTVRA